MASRLAAVQYASGNERKKRRSHAGKMLGMPQGCHERRGQAWSLHLCLLVISPPGIGSKHDAQRRLLWAWARRWHQARVKAGMCGVGVDTAHPGARTQTWHAIWEEKGKFHGVQLFMMHALDRK